MSDFDDEMCDFVPGPEQLAQTVTAPWTLEQVTNLNVYQVAGVFHPYTCPNRGDGQHQQRADEDLGQLRATVDGWICWDCDYKQDWALDMAAEPPRTFPCPRCGTQWSLHVFALACCA